MPTLIDNLNEIASIKSDIRSAIEAKGVDMSSASFADYPSKIGEIQTGGQFVTETLSVSVNNTYYPSSGVDGFSMVVVDVPQSVTGYTEKEITEQKYSIVNLNNSATRVGSYVFFKNSYIQTVVLPSCSYVNISAFQQCPNLSFVSLYVCKTIANSAFYNCSSLEEVYLPECETISEQAFLECKLGSLYLPACKTIGSNAFNGNTLLSTVDLPVCDNATFRAFRGCTLLTDISLPACSFLGSSVFEQCYALSEISLPVIQTIQNYAFQNCSSLTKVTMGTETYKIPGYQTWAFNGTPMLNGSGSFYVASDMYSRWIVANGWSSLASRFVSVNQSGPVLAYDNGVVSGITKYLDSSFSTFLGISKADITELSLANIKSIENQQWFQDARNMTKLSLGACEYIGGWVFHSCWSLSEINLPECKRVAYSAFESCSSLEHLSLPKCEYLEQGAFRNNIISSLTLPVCSYIGSYALANFSTSMTLTLGYSEVVSCGTSPVNSNKLSSIYVLSSLVDAYKVAPFWKTVSDKIFPIPE